MVRWWVSVLRKMLPRKTAWRNKTAILTFRNALSLTLRRYCDWIVIMHARVVMNDLRITIDRQRLWNAINALLCLQPTDLLDAPRHVDCKSPNPLDTTAKCRWLFALRIWDWMSVADLIDFCTTAVALFLLQIDWTVSTFRILNSSECLRSTLKDTFCISAAALFFALRILSARKRRKLDCTKITAWVCSFADDLTRNCLTHDWINVEADVIWPSAETGLVDRFVNPCSSVDVDGRTYFGMLSMRFVRRRCSDSLLIQFWITPAELSLKLDWSRLNICSRQAFTTKMASFRRPHFSAKIFRLTRHFNLTSQLSRRGVPFSSKWMPTSRCHSTSMVSWLIFTFSMIHQQSTRPIAFIMLQIPIFAKRMRLDVTELGNSQLIHHDLKSAAEATFCALWYRHKHCITVADVRWRFDGEWFSSCRSLQPVSMFATLSQLMSHLRNFACIIRKRHWIKMAEAFIKLNCSSCNTRLRDALTVRVEMVGVLQRLMKVGLDALHVRITTALSILWIPWLWKWTRTARFHSTWTAKFSIFTSTTCFVPWMLSAANVILSSPIFIRRIRLFVRIAL